RASAAQFHANDGELGLKARALFSQARLWLRSMHRQRVSLNDPKLLASSIRHTSILPRVLRGPWEPRGKEKIRNLKFQGTARTELNLAAETKKRVGKKSVTRKNKKSARQKQSSTFQKIF